MHGKCQTVDLALSRVCNTASVLLYITLNVHYRILRITISRNHVSFHQYVIVYNLLYIYIYCCTCTLLQSHHVALIQYPRVSTPLENVSQFQKLKHESSRKHQNNNKKKRKLNNKRISLCWYWHILRLLRIMLWACNLYSNTHLEREVIRESFRQLNFLQWILQRIIICISCYEILSGTFLMIQLI